MMLYLNAKIYINIKVLHDFNQNVQKQLIFLDGYC